MQAVGFNGIFKWPHWPTHFILMILVLTSVLAYFLWGTAFTWVAWSCLFWVLFCVVLGLSGFIQAGWIRDLLQSLATIVCMMGLYVYLGYMAFDVIPWIADPFLTQIDSFLGLGTSPVFLVETYSNELVVEFSAAIYSFFIPYLYLSIFICLMGRPQDEKKMFVTALAITYAISFLGYLFLPARGPIVSLANEFQYELSGGGFLALVRQSIEQVGGPHGAFPSLHVGASWLFCFFDLRRGQLRGWLYVPIVLMIAVSTLILRYHYAIDLLAGFAIASSAVLLAERIHDLSKKSWTLPSAFWNFFLRFFFQDMQLGGAVRSFQELKKAKKPVLLLCNHRNAFVDPFVLQAVLKVPITLTAKASLKRNVLFNFIMKMLKVVPLARSSDHPEGDRRETNKIGFQKCLDAFDRYEWVCLFPEGKSHSEPSLLPLKTGAARLALEHDNLEVLPLGLFYEQKEKFGSRIHVELGEPISMSTWLQSNDANDFHKLTHFFEEKLKEVTVNHDDRNQEEWLSWTSQLFQNSSLEPTPLDQYWHFPENHIDVRQEFIRQYQLHNADPQVQVVKKEVEGLKRLLERKDIPLDEINLPMRFWDAVFFTVREVEMAVVGGLWFLVGLLLNGLPLLLTRIAVKLTAKDEDHWATHYLFFGASIWMVYAMVLGVLFPFPLGLFLECIALFFLFFAVRFFFRFHRIIKRSKTFMVFLLHPSIKKEIQDRTGSIVQKLIQINQKQGRL